MTPLSTSRAATWPSARRCWPRSVVLIRPTPQRETMSTSAGVCRNVVIRIGFSPAAIVWHHRRKTVKSYLKQQMGYGKAEAMLLQKHPDRFNAVGCARWAGRIYGGIRRNVSTAKGFIYYGPFGSGLFQRVYHAPHSWLADLPLSLEWNIVTVLLLLGGFLSPLLLIIGGLSAIASLGTAVQHTMLTDVPVQHHRMLGKLLDWCPALYSATGTWLGSGQACHATATAPDSLARLLPPFAWETCGNDARCCRIGQKTVLKKRSFSSVDPTIA